MYFVVLADHPYEVLKKEERRLNRYWMIDELSPIKGFNSYNFLVAKYGQYAI